MNDILKIFKEFNLIDNEYYNWHTSRKIILDLLESYKKWNSLTKKQVVLLKRSYELFSKYVKNNPYSEKYKWKWDEDAVITKEIKQLFNSLTGKNGIYFIYDNNIDEIVYIGKTVNLSNRMYSSLREKNKFRFSYIETKSHIDCCILELYYISIHKPIFNKDPVIIDNIHNIEIKHKYTISNIYELGKPSIRYDLNKIIGNNNGKT
jgi:hypothetical protein